MEDLHAVRYPIERFVGHEGQQALWRDFNLAHMVAYHDHLGVAFTLPPLRDDQIDPVAHVPLAQLFDPDFLIHIGEHRQAALGGHDDRLGPGPLESPGVLAFGVEVKAMAGVLDRGDPDRKSTRLNSSHGYISYAVFCLKKKKKIRADAVWGTYHL